MTHVKCATYPPCFRRTISLTTYPSSFALYENACELHKYTREQKKKKARGEGNGFDGELVNFQEPNLSSLSKLVRLR